MAVLVVLNSTICISASAAEHPTSSTLTTAKTNTVTISGEKYTFFKDGMEYKVSREDGTVNVWAYDVLISSSIEPVPSITRSSGWIYLQTDRYVTYINYEVLLPMLQAADSLATLSVELGISVAVLAYITSVSPTAYYREDITYYYSSDPLYFMIISNFYKDASYTELIDSITKYQYS